MIAARKTVNRMAKSKATGIAKTNKAAADSNEVLNSTLQQIEKAFGQGSIMPLGSDAEIKIAGLASVVELQILAEQLSLSASTTPLSQTRFYRSIKHRCAFLCCDFVDPAVR